MKTLSKVSYVDSTYVEVPEKSGDYRVYLDLFKSGKWDDLIQSLQKIREKDVKKYKQEKQKTLPAVLFSGKFKGGKHDGDLSRHSGLICLDWDELKEDELLELREALKMDDFIHAIWKSPSGAGLKALVKIPRCNMEDHKLRWTALQQRYPSIDPQCKNVSRLCYVCSDTELWINEDSFEFQDISEQVTSRKFIDDGEGYEDGFPGIDGQGRNPYLLSLGAKIRNRGGSDQEIEDVLRGRNSRFVDPMDDSEVDFLISRVIGYRKSEGGEFIPVLGAHNDGEKTYTPESKKNDIDISEFEVDLTKTIDEPPNAVVIIRQSGTQFLPYKFMRLKEFSVLNGWTGHKKSMAVSVITTVVLGGDYDSFRCEASKHGYSGVVYIDTEQGDYDILDIKRRVEENGGNIKGLNIYKLRSLSVQEKRDAVDKIFKKHTDVALIVLDNIADLIWNNNNPEQAKEMENMMLNWVDKNGAHVMLVIHSNKPKDGDSSGGATGHIGSSLMKKCEVGMEIVEVKEDTSSSKITFWKNRGGVRPPPMILSYVGKNKIELREEYISRDN